jgi:hypothetical protein
MSWESKVNGGAADASLFRDAKLIALRSGMPIGLLHKLKENEVIAITREVIRTPHRERQQFMRGIVFMLNYALQIKEQRNGTASSTGEDRTDTVAQERSDAANR